MNLHIAVTGMGICSPIGTSIDQFASRLREGHSGIEAYTDVFQDRSVYAGIVNSPVNHGKCTSEQLAAYDRTAKMGLHAALEALEDAGIDPLVLDDRIGLVLGTSHGGRSQLDRFVENGSKIEGPETSRSLLVTSAHFQQTAAVAAVLSVHGPTVTLSNACSSSGAAIAYAIELLRSGQCDYVLAGGADGFSKLTLSGFSSLGAVSQSRCAPFSEPIGLSLGDGSGFLVLERAESAAARNAKVHAELWGYGLSWDAYHITAPEPSGEGMVRAMKMAVGQAGIDRSEIGYVNVHGTGTRSNDVAEVVGLRHFFGGDDKVPPISATKSQTGHMLGASSVVGVITSIVGMKNNWLPPTSNFTTPRSGCELDCVPNTARDSQYACFMAQSAAFAGANAVIIGGDPSRRVSAVAAAPKFEDVDDIVISGMGLVSPLGFTVDDYFAALRDSTPGISDVEDPALNDCKCRHAGYVRDFQPRKLMPTLKLRRVDRVASYATIATGFALQHAGLWPIAGAGGDIGLIVGVSRGAATSYEKYLASVEGSKWEKASAVHFPNLVMSSVGGQVSSMLGIRGITSSLVGGTAAGLQALSHAYELFRRNPTQEAVVVVASDEIAPLFFQLFDQLGVLRSGDDGAQGMVLGEGAVAFVLERKKSVERRNIQPLARIGGYGMTNDAAMPRGLEPSGQWMARAMEKALHNSGTEQSDIDAVFCNQLNLPAHDQRDANSLRTVFGDRPVPVCGVNGLQGVAEAASGLFHVAAAILSMQHGIALQAGGDAPSNGSAKLHRTMVCASGDDGSNISMVLVGA
jgi:3-oxoacyl-[acyl-carrier-protein] synthase II